MNETKTVHRQAHARIHNLAARMQELTDKDGPWSVTDEREAAALVHSMRLTLETIRITREAAI